MKSLFLLITLTALVNSASGQTQSEASAGRKCPMTMAHSPTIRGLKLGMDLEEVFQQFPDRRTDPSVRQMLQWADKQFGVARFSASTYPYQSEKRFAGISQFDFEFLDNRLSAFGVHYEGPEWNSVDEFISRVAESLNLPNANYWTPSNPATIKTLKCEGFEITAMVGGPGSNSLRIRNPAAEQIVRTRQIEAKERARKEFKP